MKHLGSKCLCVALLLASVGTGAAVFAAELEARRFTADEIRRAESVQVRYGSMPKGVMIEGAAQGIDGFRSVSYDKKQNALVFDGKGSYRLQVSAKDFVTIYNALAKDDRLGVSITKVKQFVYGEFPAESGIAQAMFETDRVLCRVIFGFNQDLAGITLPGNYVPKMATHRPTTVAAYIIFQEFKFALKDGEYKLASRGMDVNLFATKGAQGAKASDGGHLIDEEAMAKGMIAREDIENVDHINKNKAGYMELADVARTLKFGEAAAIARLLRDTKTDVSGLLKSMK